MTDEEKRWLKHYEPEVPHTVEYPPIPLHRCLEDTAKRFPYHRALVFYNGVLPYRRLDDLATRFAAALNALGVRKGDRVALHLPNSPQFVIAYYGALKAGAIVTPINPLYVEREIRLQLQDSQAATIVTLSRFYPLIKGIKKETALRHVIVTNIKEYFHPLLRILFTLFKEKKEGHRVTVEEGEDVHLFGNLLRAYAPQNPDVNVQPEDMALLQYTGGTTGIPKGAMLTHANLVANTIQTRLWFTKLVEGQERMLAVLPFFHVYGMTVAMNMGIYTGATLLLLPRFDLKEVLAIIQKYKPTLFPGVPTIYVAINSAPDISRYDLRSITACISGAAPLPLEVLGRFEELTGGRLVEGYGLTEAAPVTHANPIFGLRKAGSIGIPFPDVEAKIIDPETGDDLPQGQMGELAVKGPQVMKGYWRLDEETSRVLKDGWLLTGDIAQMDQDGYFYIVDRKKEMILSGGYNIYPREIEESLYQHPKVKEAAVIGIPDPYKGETPKAFVVLKEGQGASQEEILEYCRTVLAKYKVPTCVEFRSELPKSMIGKVLRRVLKEESITGGTPP